MTVIGDEKYVYEEEILKNKLILNKGELIRRLENDDNTILIKLVNHKFRILKFFQNYLVFQLQF